MRGERVLNVRASTLVQALIYLYQWYWYVDLDVDHNTNKPDCSLKRKDKETQGLGQHPTDHLALSTLFFAPLLYENSFLQNKRIRIGWIFGPQRFERPGKRLASWGLIGSRVLLGLVQKKSCRSVRDKLLEKIAFGSWRVNVGGLKASASLRTWSSSSLHRCGLVDCV